MNILSINNKLDKLKEVTGGSISCGYMCDEVAFLLYSIVKFYNPEVIIQTGHLWGKSALICLESLNDGFLQNEFNVLEKNINKNDDILYRKTIEKNTPIVKKRSMISIDPFYTETKESYLKGVEFLKTEYHNFIFFNEFSDKVLKDMITSKILENNSILGIVDGDHSYQGCLNDIEYMSALGSKIIIVDDTLYLPDCRQACIDFCVKNNKSLFFYDQYNGIAIINNYINI